MRHRLSPHFEALLLHPSEYQKVPLTRIPQFIQVTRLLIRINIGGAQQIKIDYIETMALITAHFYSDYNSDV
jgi:hypothetical protein